MIATSYGLLGSSLFTLPALESEDKGKKGHPVKIMVAGGHHDHPESGKGGTS